MQTVLHNEKHKCIDENKSRYVAPHLELPPSDTFLFQLQVGGSWMASRFKGFFMHFLEKSLSMFRKEEKMRFKLIISVL